VRRGHYLIVFENGVEYQVTNSRRTGHARSIARDYEAKLDGPIARLELLPPTRHVIHRRVDEAGHCCKRNRRRRNPRRPSDLASSITPSSPNVRPEPDEQRIAHLDAGPHERDRMELRRLPLLPVVPLLDDLFQLFPCRLVVISSIGYPVTSRPGFGVSRIRRSRWVGRERDYRTRVSGIRGRVGWRQ
jgi:hypothetical protein